jgi:hypothetical protein
MLRLLLELLGHRLIASPEPVRVTIRIEDCASHPAPVDPVFVEWLEELYASPSAGGRTPN